ncbi:helix-turn-helix domain-containing protein [Pseudomonas aeruginosa]|uniref:helix-turn-helix domain-containing protein n=1 Tax=Pseudomonas aeruginosa TaxID=287 RepID=UPI00163CE2F4|nr:helix-turn-helix domain-containing protein [Pseudomonas aeruginosa]
MTKACYLNPLPEVITELLEEGFAHNLKLRKGECLFHQGAPAASIFIMLSGTVKTTVNTECGKEIITGFYFPGEVLGLSGMGSKTYLTSAKALETVFACELSYTHLFKLSRQPLYVQTILISIVTNELLDQQNLLISTRKIVDARLAHFIFNIAKKNHTNGLPARQLYLTMTRQDIGNHLGVAIESVSRSLTRLQKDSIIIIHKENIDILDMDALYRLATKQE